mmetsp:Transcript_139613/g.241248  ORF Transcript_139613/g.241248 Transcript_139613/m.241248 type:complete len:207 (+) Transcript_139613:2391-3011(+)
MLSNRVANPVQAIGRLDLQQLSSRVREAVQVSAVDLKKRQIAQDLDVVSVIFQGLPVALYCFGVLSVLTVQEAVDVPADVTLQVVLQALPDKVIRLTLLVQVAESQPFHAQGFSMVPMLFEDGVSSLHPLLVLLGLIEFHDRAEDCLVLGRERLHDCEGLLLKASRGADVENYQHRCTIMPSSRQWRKCLQPQIEAEKRGRVKNAP